MSRHPRLDQRRPLDRVYARKLGIGKSGFYWHFHNKHELLRALLDYRVHEITDVITANPQIRELDPETRLRKTVDVICRK